LQACRGWIAQSRGIIDLLDTAGLARLASLEAGHPS
jgi:hypothetical protein